MKKTLYMLAIGFSLSTLAACGGGADQNVEEENNSGTPAEGVGPGGTPGGLIDVGDTIRTDETDTTETP